MNTPLRDEIEKVKNKISFGMPGHKGNKFFDLSEEMDLTEILGTDNLLNPEGSIADLHKEIKNLFESKESFMTTNGSTGALHIAISMVTKPKDKILIQRNAHKSIYNALLLNDLDPIYLNTIYDKNRGMYFGIDKREFLKKINDNDIKACVLVSPNYFGGILKLREIIRILHDKNIVVIVDEAHGTHLYFSDLKKYSALDAGADLVINSTHKMIPSLTQSAIIHRGTDRFSHEDLLKYINIYNTTSPSYLLMLSMEAGLKYMDEIGRSEIKNRILDLEELKNEINYNLNLSHESIIANDPMKFLFRIPNMTGKEIVEDFLINKNIRLEMGDLYYALAIISPINTSKEIKKLKEAILSYDINECRKIFPINFEIPKREMFPKEAFLSEGEYVDYRNACGRVAKTIIAAYPPGVPLVSFGEVINKDIIESIDKFLSEGIEVIGLLDKKIEVVK
ncbi:MULTISPECIES: aminotransferase class I/II-fold pyridoxal phosphate-dependent enzyme [Peptoniphilus]|uniref:aminotransferase class I/II-fold pyridoxal phosphate-dependent enzyme n=1 Tax=Peptoniphilus TaxID=162289 RepID=UPI0009F47438|nr:MULTISPECIES: aminotransferase class V-fold PLP-dependent enzyme [Peptoniphilus]MDU1042904.1 aminotransferase class I/II-fold pyridoxal phosphate-dependent enzyme [Peptoniphilus rhinitidis]MDU5376934.1 aminotransferase class I/II-fold pyridoxal phosphate-dependent enzyme [Peptoniphilus lacydonensis]MDU5436345.1 aminotransferase class I/II-fold pyridoxal phosphate-dependent enzyme [Peptoniphilus lacydonensis]